MNRIHNICLLFQSVNIFISVFIGLWGILLGWRDFGLNTLLSKLLKNLLGVLFLFFFIVLVLLSVGILLLFVFILLLYLFVFLLLFLAILWFKVCLFRFIYFQLLWINFQLLLLQLHRPIIISNILFLFLYICNIDFNIVNCLNWHIILSILLLLLLHRHRHSAGGLGGWLWWGGIYEIMRVGWGWGIELVLLWSLYLFQDFS